MAGVLLSEVLRHAMCRLLILEAPQQQLELRLKKLKLCSKSLNFLLSLSDLRNEKAVVMQALTLIFQVRQFVCRVNEKTVLYLDYKTVTRLVMTGPRVVVLEVMEPLD